jgi:hypothetical protein
MDAEVSNSSAHTLETVILTDMHSTGAGNIEPDTSEYAPHIRLESPGRR